VPADVALAQAQAAGVEALVCVGTDLATSRHAVELAQRHPEVRATVGLHPHEAKRLAQEWPALEALARDHADVVAGIGEGGFDLFYEHSERDDQEAAFRVHVELAHALDRALVIHSRDAWDDTFAVLTDMGVPARTVFHCFTGGPAEAERCLALGAHLSFSGIITFKTADDVRAAAARCPLDRMTVETDSPYLAPTPHRGQPNQPAWVPLVGAAVAAAKGVTAEEVAAATTLNAERLFRLRSGYEPT
jgi:TatD DNase family protein